MLEAGAALKQETVGGQEVGEPIAYRNAQWERGVFSVCFCVCSVVTLETDHLLTDLTDCLTDFDWQPELDGKKDG